MKMAHLTRISVVCGLIVGMITGASVRGQEPVPITYVITGARVVPVSGPVLDTGTVVFRDGIITAVGAAAAAPPGAVTINGTGLTVYPGLIDLGSTAGIEPPPRPQAPSQGQGEGQAPQPQGQPPPTTEDSERAKRAQILRPQFLAAEALNPTAPALARAAAAGITSVLAAPAGDAIRGQSALIHTAPGPDAPQIGAVADNRRRPMVIRSPVALHVSFAARPGTGNAYPNSLLGVIAFVRQAFVDARHQQAALQHDERANGTTPLPDEAMAAMQPAISRRMPVAFEAETAREILRVLDMAKALEVDPLVTNAREAGAVTADLKSANARVILSLNYPKRPESLAPDADEPLRTLRARADAPKAAAALETAGVMFAFESHGLGDPGDFLKNAARAVQAGLSREAAVRALTLNAATIAGAADRVGSLQPGRMANLLVTEGDLFDDAMRIRYVFVRGAAVNR